METRWIFRPAKLVRKKYVGMSGYFDQQNYIEKKVHGNDGNSSKFGFRSIDVIPTSNRRQFDVVCPLGMKNNTYGEFQISNQIIVYL